MVQPSKSKKYSP